MSLLSQGQNIFDDQIDCSQQESRLFVALRFNFAFWIIGEAKCASLFYIVTLPTAKSSSQILIFRKLVL